MLVGHILLQLTSVLRCCFGCSITQHTIGLAARIALSLGNPTVSTGLSSLRTSAAVVTMMLELGFWLLLVHFFTHLFFGCIAAG